MSFKVAGDSSDAPIGSGSGGIEMDWSLLKQGGCPKCGAELVHFHHIDLWKCICGFKITSARAREVVDSMMQHGRGFSFGNYDQESPF